MNKFVKTMGVIGLSLCLATSISGCTTQPIYVEGKSAYEIAVENGFTGTEKEWLDSLKAQDGKSAYEIAVENGFVGSEVDWLNSLAGKDLSANDLFNLAVQQGLCEDTPEGYKKFLETYINNIKDTSPTVVKKVASQCLNQAVSVYAEVDSTSVSMGSGVIYKIDKVKREMYVITNYHVVGIPVAPDSELLEPAQNIYCYIYGRETAGKGNPDESFYGDGAIKAVYLGGTAAYDVAVLKISGAEFDKLPSYLEAVTFRDTNSLQPGELAIAIGNAKGRGIAVTSGVVSMTNEYTKIPLGGAERIVRGIRIDTSVNKGNSGGGLFDSDGKLLGLVNSQENIIYSNDISHALCGNNVKAVAENIIYHFNKNMLDESVIDRTSGVHLLNAGVALHEENYMTDYDPISGHKLYRSIVVEKITEDKIFNQLDVRVGDIILGMSVKKSGEEHSQFVKFDAMHELLDYIITLRDGDEIVIKLNRGGDTIDTLNKVLTVQDFTEKKNNEV